MSKYECANPWGTKEILRKAIEYAVKRGLYDRAKQLKEIVENLP